MSRLIDQPSISHSQKERILMKEINEFYGELEEAFPNCIFTNKSNKIILNDGSFHNERPAIMMDKVEDNEYEFGILKKITEFVYDRGFGFDHDDGEVLIVKL